MDIGQSSLSDKSNASICSSFRFAWSILNETYSSKQSTRCCSKTQVLVAYQIVLDARAICSPSPSSNEDIVCCKIQPVHREIDLVSYGYWTNHTHLIREFIEYQKKKVKCIVISMNDVSTFMEKTLKWSDSKFAWSIKSHFYRVEPPLSSDVQAI